MDDLSCLPASHLDERVAISIVVRADFPHRPSAEPDWSVGG
jgi:hypothetical protein